MRNLRTTLRDGIQPDEVPSNRASSGSTARMTERWRFPTNHGFPTVVDGVIYLVQSASTVKTIHSVWALNATDGTMLWQFHTSGQKLNSSPAVMNGVVYVGTESGWLIALSATDGSERWRLSTGARIFASPTVLNGVVYVGNLEGTLLAANASDGIELWRYSGTEPIYGKPALADGVVYVGSGDSRGNGSLSAVDAREGRLKWRFPAGYSVEQTPVVRDGAIYFGSVSGPFYSLSVKDGTILWKLGTGGVDTASSTIHGEVAYIAADRYSFSAIRLRDGKELWRQTVGFRVIPSPVVSDGVLLVGDADGILHALATDNGRPKWRFEFQQVLGSGDKIVALAADKGVVYVASEYGGLRSLDGRDGKEKWRFGPEHKSGTYLRVIDDCVLFAAKSGGLYALGTAAISHTILEPSYLRGGPSAAAVVRANLATGTPVTVTGESVISTGVEWQLVLVNETQISGWVEMSKIDHLPSQ